MRRIFRLMQITDYASFDRLCAQNGIIEAYYDIRGVHHVASVEARCTLLNALGFQADSDAAVHTSLEQMQQRRWQEMVAPVTVYRENSHHQDIVLNLNEDQRTQPLQWLIRSENGELYSPARFIPIAEKYNVMTEVDQWVFSHVRGVWVRTRTKVSSAFTPARKLTKIL